MTKITPRARLQSVIGGDIQHKRKTDTWIFRKEFFYTHGYSAEKFADKITERLNDAGMPHRLVTLGEVWKPFRGGANTKQSSHWYVEVYFSHPGVIDPALDDMER